MKITDTNSITKKQSFKISWLTPAERWEGDIVVVCDQVYILVLYLKRNLRVFLDQLPNTILATEYVQFGSHKEDGKAFGTIEV